MAQKSDRNRILYPLGVTCTGDEIVILLQAKGKEAKLLLYRAGEDTAFKELAFKEEDRIGDVWEMTVPAGEVSMYEYGFSVDGEPVADASARILSGRGKWKDLSRVGKPVKARFLTEDFDWEDDKNPEIPYADTIIYRLHVRGFTKHASSKVKERGTFAGLAEKIPYLKELGVTAVELMPVTEFDEIMMPESQGNPLSRQEPTGVVNYWGYGPSFLYAVKSAYASGKDMSPEREFKNLVKALHKAGLECIPELYFTGKEAPGQVLNALRYWVTEYHVDGFHLSGYAPLELIAGDPFLSGTKLLAADWNAVFGKLPGKGYVAPGDGAVTVRDKHLAECNNGFQDEMRRFLKGDEDMIRALEYRTRNNPADYAAVNYMANTNGFTMMDMVSYDRKHNEKNGEDNRDGSDYNHSWNCGAEGPTRKKKIVELRKRQLCSAWLLLLLSQGVPMILAGDEFGNSQEGNNNAYCQDNEISWLNWKLRETNWDLFEFVKGLIAFRKAHPIFHMDREPRIMDYKSCGRPDVSYHGENAWRPEYENFRRQFGILYCGAYAKRADGSEDENFYVAYNMHWEPHVFGLPHLPKGQLWHTVYDSHRGPALGAYAEGKEPVLKDQTQAVIPPRSIMVFCGKHGSGYYFYETPIGDITVVCRDEEVVRLSFGRMTPEEKGMEEVRTELSDKVFAQLSEYFTGERKEFDLPLNPEGTEFQKKVWKELCKIPFGEMRTYKEIAAAAGDEKASRAVGSANNKNPLPILIPCHRVIGANGALVGYAGGNEIKKRLLELEQGKEKEERKVEEKAEEK